MSDKLKLFYRIYEKLELRIKKAAPEIHSKSILFDLARHSMTTICCYSSVTKQIKCMKPFNMCSMPVNSNLVIEIRFHLNSQGCLKSITQSSMQQLIDSKHDSSLLPLFFLCTACPKCEFDWFYNPSVWDMSIFVSLLNFFRSLANPFFFSLSIVFNPCLSVLIPFPQKIIALHRRVTDSVC